MRAVLVIAHARDECGGKPDTMRGDGGIGRVADGTDLGYILVRYFVAEADTQLARTVVRQFFRILEPDKRIGRDVADPNKVVFHGGNCNTPGAAAAAEHRAANIQISTSYGSGDTHVRFYERKVLRRQLPRACQKQGVSEPGGDGIVLACGTRVCRAQTVLGRELFRPRRVPDFRLCCIRSGNPYTARHVDS